jgi:ADP-ribosylation factor 1/2
LIKYYILKDAIVVIFANKKDLPNVMSCGEIKEKLDLNSIKQKWLFQSCCAINGDGIIEGFEWSMNCF